MGEKYLRHSNEQGSIYITVVIILAVILMVLGMLIVITGRDMRTSNLYSEGIRAHYIAQSGIAKGIEFSRTDPKINKAELTEDNIFSSDYSAFHRLKWQVNYNSTDKNYRIISEGLYRYNDKIDVRRMLEVIIKVQDGTVELVSWKQQYE